VKIQTFSLLGFMGFDDKKRKTTPF